MKMKQFFHLTFIFLFLVCLAHSAGAITDFGKKWAAPQLIMGNSHIMLAVHR